MQKIFLVEDNDLSEVNQYLKEGGEVVMIQAVSESVAAYGYAGGECCYHGHDIQTGHVYAYVVLDMPLEYD